MIAYPVELTPDDNGTFQVTAPDFPELTTFGDTTEESLERAQDALLEAIEARVHNGEPIPQPSRGKHLVRLPAQAAIKVLLYQALEAEGIRKSELARRMSVPRPHPRPQPRNGAAQDGTGVCRPGQAAQRGGDAARPRAVAMPTIRLDRMSKWLG